jgi:integrase
LLAVVAGQDVDAGDEGVSRTVRRVAVGRVISTVVQELAGHANPNITLSVYAHVLPGMAKAAGERLSAQLFS